MRQWKVRQWKVRQWGNRKSQIVFKFLKLSILAQRRRVSYVFAELSILEKSFQRRPERSHPPKTPNSKALL